MPYIGRSTDGFGVRNRFLYLASASDTSVSGADANGAILSFSDGAYVDVYLNGVLLKAGTDYNTNTANTIAGISSMSANDEVTVIVYDVFTVGDMVSATSGGTFTGGVTFNGAVTLSSTVSGLDVNGTEIILDADGDTTITADTDDQIDIKIAGADDFQFTANTFTAQSGSTIAAQALTATTITATGDISFNGGDFVFNESGAAKDFRVEGDSKDNLFLVDGSADKVGINTSSPDALLDVEGTTDAEVRITRTAASTATTFNDAGSVLNLVNNVNYENGYNGGASIGQILFTSNDSSTGAGIRAKIGCTATTYYHAETLDFYVSPNNTTTNQVSATSNSTSKHMTINGDGRIGIGDTGQTNTGMTITQSVSSATLKVTNTTNDYQGNNLWSVLADNTNDTDCNLYAGYSAGGHRYFVAGNGNVTNVNNSYGSYSDEKLKENISDASSQWDDIKGLKIRNFSWKVDSLDKANMIGLIAQEAEKISPNLIEETKDTNTILTIKDENKNLKDEDGNDIKDADGNTIDNPNYGKEIPNPKFGEIIEGQTTKTLKYSVLYMKAVKALQEAMERIETLEAKVKALEEA